MATNETQTFGGLEPSSTSRNRSLPQDLRPNRVYKAEVLVSTVIALGDVERIGEIYPPRAL